VAYSGACCRFYGFERRFATLLWLTAGLGDTSTCLMLGDTSTASSGVLEHLDGFAALTGGTSATYRGAWSIGNIAWRRRLLIVCAQYIKSYGAEGTGLRYHVTRSSPSGLGVLGDALPLV
jgi:hypothetical protein